ncbi:hypothetical protein [Enhygromyxa salina]|uniref:Outer membrane protein assembly factor BamB n=1 Tax=Enhygromyxa salina TaxID=215803 RepID=A0A2S9XT74_9BACT|nr:hypothetical protein [Enhygromyxa salina]PRP96062.1 hypothetical protein ENSA7_68760 [Enhygromyxa salina]
MAQTIHYQPIVLLATFVILMAGCELEPGQLEVGSESDDGDASTDDESGGEQLEPECLIGTDIDAVGVEQSSWAPPCEVVCDQGWGHGGEQLEIDWTISEFPQPYEALRPRGLGLLVDDEVVVGAFNGVGLDLITYDATGQLLWRRTSAEVVGEVGELTTTTEGIYVLHADGIHGGLSAFENDGEHRWTREFGDAFGYGVAGSDAGIAVVRIRDPYDEPEFELVLFGVDGEVIWAVPTAELGRHVAFSGTNDTIGVVGGGDVSMHSTADGAYVGGTPTSGTVAPVRSGLVFIDEETIINVGGIMDSGTARFNGWFERLTTDPSSWSYSYNRASSWCPDPDSPDPEASTSENFFDVVELADGTMLAVGQEIFYAKGGGGEHPRSVQFSPTGEFLRSDRALWDGRSVAAVATSTGESYVLTTATNDLDGAEGFRVRRYTAP